MTGRSLLSQPNIPCSTRFENVRFPRVTMNKLFILKVVLTIEAVIPPQAGTPSVLKTALPTTVPMPKSESVMKVPIRLVKSSGVHVANAINVAPATSWLKLKSASNQTIYIISVHVY